MDVHPIRAGWLPWVVSRCDLRGPISAMSPLHSIWPVLMSCVLGFVSLFFGGQSVVNCCIVCLCVCFLASLNAVLLAGSAHWLPVCLLDCLIACSFRYMRLACFACRLIGWLAGEALPCAVMTLILVAKGAFFQRPIKSWRVEASKTSCSVSNIWVAGTFCLTGIQPTFQGQAIIIKTMVISCNISNCYHYRTNLGLPKNGVYPETAILMQEISLRNWNVAFLKSLNIHE